MFRKLFYLFFVFSLVACKEDAVLSSWNEGTNKQKIIEYIEDITNKNSPNFIPIEDRIAVFDNDGTLWAEKPLVQGLYIFNRVMSGGYSSPEITKAKLILLSGKNLEENMSIEDLLKIMLDVMSNVTIEAIESDTIKFFATKKYKNFNIKMNQVAYKPQVEFVKFLQDNGFTVYICSGGDVDFMRAVSKDFYNIEKEHVIGSSVKYTYDYEKNKVLRTNELDLINDMENKPVNIARHIGKIPVVAVGNVGNSGDVAMLNYSDSSKYKTLQFLVYHDDEVREALYGQDDKKSLEEVKRNNWNLISMKNDWKIIFNN